MTEMGRVARRALCLALVVLACRAAAGVEANDDQAKQAGRAQQSDRSEQATRAEQSQPVERAAPRVAALVTAYYHNSHADMIASRLLQGYLLNGTGEFPRMKLASVYVDQFPKNDTSRALAAKHGFRLSPTIADALTLGTDKLAVDGVLLIAEHGNYPESPTGSIIYPKRPWFAEIARVMEASGRVAPVFCDKHLADNWIDAKWIYDEAQRRKIPFLAGSSLPVLWRYPAVDVARDARLQEIVAVSYHRLDIYGFHALEMVQSLVERRAGGESGVAAVQCLEGDAVWEAGRQGRYDRELLAAALSRLKERPLPKDKSLEQLVPQPQLFLIEYRDGLKAAVLTLNYVVVEWAAGWRYAATPPGRTAVESTVFWTQEARPFMHFSFLTQGIDRMMTTGQPPWPAERTLLTTGMLDALLQSRGKQGRRIETPELEVRYRSDWNWRMPPPPPPGRPIEAP